ncbi:MAG: carboxypeptidase-like regulatory domain-containing protein [Gemmatimonadota bacterium]|nr:carboxypeptidase-like regulatory domain-containing protein [Gemmatimonadota bacterium]
MTLRACFVILVAAALSSQPLHAQGRTVQGRAVDARTGAPVDNVSVTVVGTPLVAFGESDGTFTLRNVPQGPVTLLVRRIGYRRIEVQLSATQNSVSIQLEPDILRLEEVVVTGQATGIERRNLANAVSTVSAQDLERAPTATVERALQGKVPGANIQANSNAPGGGVQVELRGITSLLGGSPLYVVDGVIVSDVAERSGMPY